jgi:predicted alpha/beta superfamily hydrolase
MFYINRCSLLLILISIIVSCSPEQPIPPSPVDIASGRIERHENFPSQYVQARNIDVWLPDEYEKVGEGLPVLYMHDGQMLFDSTTTWNKQEWGVDETMGRLIKEKVIKPCIVVGIWNPGAARHANYFPQKPFESLPASYRDSLYNDVERSEGVPLFSQEVNSDDYLKFIVEEVKPYIDSVYRTNRGVASTFIAGSSMGGLISMYAICEYPEVFSGAACLSTHWPGVFYTENNPIPKSFSNYLFDNLPNPKKYRIYFDYGTETLDAMYEPFQLQVDSVMTAKGYTADNWVTKKFEGKDHSERAWNERLDIPIRFLFKE